MYSVDNDKYIHNIFLDIENGLYVNETIDIVH